MTLFIAHLTGNLPGWDNVSNNLERAETWGGAPTLGIPLEKTDLQRSLKTVGISLNYVD